MSEKSDAAAGAPARLAAEEQICGRYGHDGCPNPIEPGWVFCHEHRLSHVGPTREEELAAAEQRGFARGVECATWAVRQWHHEGDDYETLLADLGRIRFVPPDSFAEGSVEPGAHPAQDPRDEEFLTHE